MSYITGFIIALGTVAGILFLAVGEQQPDLKEVLANCESEDDSIKLAAIAALGNYPESLETTALLACRFSVSRDEMERGAAEIAIKTMGPDMLQHVVPMLSSVESTEVNGAVNAFATIGGETKVGDEGLFELVRSKDPRKNFLGLKALQEMGRTAVPVRDRVAELLQSKEFNVQLRACNVLAAIGPDAEPALDDLLAIAESGNMSVRSSAMIAIGAIGESSDDPRILAALSEKLDAFHVMIKERSLLGVARMGVKANSLLPKVEVLMNDKSKSMMPEAAYAYSQIGGDMANAEKVLVALKDHPTYQTRVLVQIEKLGPRATSGLLDLAIEKLNSEEPSVRESAIFALTKMGSKASKAVPKLRQMVSRDDDSLVRQTARQAIMTISKSE